MENGLENKLLKTYINSSPNMLGFELTTDKNTPITSLEC